MTLAAIFETIIQNICEVWNHFILGQEGKSQ